MSKHPSARGTYSKAHGVFSPSQAQTKHVLTRESPSSLLSPQPQHSTRSCWDRCDSHPQQTLPKMPRHRALPAAEKYCTISEAGDVLGRGCYQGLQQPGKHLINTYSFQRGTELCTLVSWLWNLADTSFWEGFQRLEEWIIMKKIKILRLLTVASGKDIAGCYPGAISNTTYKKLKETKLLPNSFHFP